MEPEEEFQYFPAVQQELNGLLRDYCEEMGFLFLGEARQALMEEGRPHSLRSGLSSDGAHLNHQGYQIMGKAMVRQLVGLVEKGQTVLLMGDSITAGFPWYEPVLKGENIGDKSHCFGHYIETMLECQVINRGISGDLTSYMVGRLKHQLDREPDLVIIQGGTNDAFTSHDFLFKMPNQELASKVTREIFDNLRDMAEMSQVAGAKVAIVPLLPMVC